MRISAKTEAGHRFRTFQRNKVTTAENRGKLREKYARAGFLPSFVKSKPASAVAAPGEGANVQKRNRAGFFFFYRKPDSVFALFIAAKLLRTVRTDLAVFRYREKKPHEPVAPEGPEGGSLVATDRISRPPETNDHSQLTEFHSQAAAIDLRAPSKTLIAALAPRHLITC